MTTFDELSKAFNDLGCNSQELLNTINELIIYLDESQKKKNTQLRPVSIAKTENSKQKSVLEISPQREWNEDFLKICE